MLLLKKIIVVTLLAIFFCCLTSWIYFNYHYAYNMPRSPQPESAREYPFNVHGTIVYLTEKESAQLNWLYTIGMIAGLSGASLYVVLKPFGEK